MKIKKRQHKHNPLCARGDHRSGPFVLRYLLLHHARDALPGVLLGHLGGDAHLLLDVLLVLVLLLLGVCCLLHVLQPQLGQVDLTLVLAGGPLARGNGWPSDRQVGWLSGRRRRLLDYQVTCRKQKPQGK